MLSAIEKHQPALVFLAYPNNPTGNLFDEDVISKIIHVAPGSKIEMTVVRGWDELKINAVVTQRPHIKRG